MLQADCKKKQSERWSVMGSTSLSIAKKAASLLMRLL